MKVAVLIMSTQNEPCISNEQGMLNTFIKYVQENKNKLNHTYDFYFYYGDKSKFSGNYINDSTFTEIRQANVYNIYCNVDESIYRTFEKTIYVFNDINGYDWYIRINISNFINIKLLDLMLDKLNDSIIYCNAINAIISDEKYVNDLYPRGDFYIMSSKIKVSILQEAKNLLFEDVKLNSDRCNVIHVDDCLIGVTLVRTFGKDYYNMLQMIKYNFFPRNTIIGFDDLAISSRVKTVPPNINHSGYSWEDNEYRRQDVEKMKLIYNKMLSIEYNKNILLNDLIPTKQNMKKICAAEYIETDIDVVKRFLKKKREKN